MALVRPSGHFAVSTVGDLNGDGFDDFALSGSGNFDDGQLASFVVFGAASDSTVVRDVANLNGHNGFRLSGSLMQARSTAAPLGDFNGDGFDDMIVSVRGNAESGGGAYVIFGLSQDYAARFDFAALDGTNGFKITGIAAGDFTGVGVDGAGDFNGDGYADVLIDATGSAAGDGALNIVFGTASSLGPELSLAELDGNNGMRIEGLAVENFFGYSSQAGDVNGDGFDDIMASSFVAEGGNTGYIVFGRDYGYGASLVGSGYADLLTGTNGADRLLGGRGDDVIDGGAGNDVLALPDHASAFLTNSKLQVLVDGDAGDSVISPGQGWINGADINVGGTVYSSYTQMGNAAMLLLDAAMTQTIS